MTAVESLAELTAEEARACGGGGDGLLPPIPATTLSDPSRPMFG